MAAADDRADRSREYTALVGGVRDAVAVMARLVRARERRPGPDRPEQRFAASGDRELPAAVWVALRQDDIDTVVEALTAISDETFVLGQREEIGEGYRLRKFDDTTPLPVLAPLLAQLSATLDIPSDVLAVLAQWGDDDPRTTAEIDELLSRFGPATAPDPEAPADAVDQAPPPDGDGLVMSVAEAADVLRLTPEQVRTLTTLVRRVGVRIVGPAQEIAPEIG